jgi:RNA-directed DNA polymerase
LNVALHGMEQAAGIRYRRKGRSNSLKTGIDCPVLVRYADDCAPRTRLEVAM